MLVDRCNGKDSILAHICMTMFKAGPCGGEERFDKLRFAKLAQESQGIASNVLVGMLQIISDSVAAERVESVHVCSRGKGGTEGVVAGY